MITSYMCWAPGLTTYCWLRMNVGIYVLFTSLFMQLGAVAHHRVRGVMSTIIRINYLCNGDREFSSRNSRIQGNAIDEYACCSCRSLQSCLCRCTAQRPPYCSFPFLARNAGRERKRMREGGCINSRRALHGVWWGDVDCRDFVHGVLFLVSAPHSPVVATPVRAFWISFLILSTCM